MSITMGDTFARLLLIACWMAAAVSSIVRWMPPSVTRAPPLAVSPPPLATPPVAFSRERLSSQSSAPQIIRRVDNPDRQIAFTFDACATRTQPNGFDRAVFRLLQQEQVPATVFASGRWVEYHPAAMQELVAEPLIEFANHSYDHPHMHQLTRQEIALEIDRTEAALAKYGRRSIAFRPPFGDFNDQVVEVAYERRLPTVLWDVVSGDPSAKMTADAMTKTVVQNTRPGSIIIFHINARAAKTAKALPAILQQLRMRGFQFVHVSTLLAGMAPKPRGPSLIASSFPAKNDEAILSLTDTDISRASEVTPMVLAPSHSPTANTPIQYGVALSPIAPGPKPMPGTFRVPHPPPFFSRNISATIAYSE